MKYALQAEEKPVLGLFFLRKGKTAPYFHGYASENTGTEDSGRMGHEAF